jgi:hypothetical protein
MMHQSNWRLRPPIGTNCVHIPFLLVIVGLNTAIREASAQPHFVEWDIEAVVISITDPQNMFSEVRLGDPVRGSMTYNAGGIPYSVDPELGAGYLHSPYFVVAEMLIENPRTGNDIEFVPRLEEGVTFVTVLDNVKISAEEPSDALDALQFVLPPGGGPTEQLGFVLVHLEAAANRFTGHGLPTQLSLDDWPIAQISFTDLGVTTIEAQITSLTPVNIAILPGDYDGDADVDANDYTVWSVLHGQAEVLDADGSGNGDIDAADYVVWRNAIIPSATSSVQPPGDAFVIVPEPSLLALLASGALMAIPRLCERILQRIQLHSATQCS